MLTYYVGAEEVGRTLGLFPKLDYFALFSQPLRLGENWDERTARDKSERESEYGTLLSRITASSIKDLAEGIALYSRTAERLCTAYDQNRDKCAVILEEDSSESYLKLGEVKRLKRSWREVMAVTPDGEKKCKTEVADSEESTKFIVRLYGQIPIKAFGYREGVIVDAFQQNSPGWRGSRHCHSFPTRDLNLSEQRSLAQRIETVFKKRARINWDRPIKQGVKLVDARKSVYPDMYKVVRD